MTRIELIAALERAPYDILEAERSVAEKSEALEFEECKVLLGGEIDGKNEAIRKAQLTCAVMKHCGYLKKAQIILHLEQNKFAALRAISCLFAGEEN